MPIRFPKVLRRRGAHPTQVIHDEIAQAAAPDPVPILIKPRLRFGYIPTPAGKDPKATRKRRAKNKVGRRQRRINRVRDRGSAPPPMLGVVLLWSLGLLFASGAFAAYAMAGHL